MKQIAIDQFSIEIPENWRVSADKDNLLRIDSGVIDNGEHVAFCVYPKKIDKSFPLEKYANYFADHYSKSTGFVLISKQIKSEEGLRFGFLEVESLGHTKGNRVRWNTYLLPMQPGEYFVFEFYSEKTAFIKYQELFRKIFLSIQ